MPKDYEIQKGQDDRPCVIYHCPECGRQIESLLRDAGSRDNCPACGKTLIIPGEAELRPPKEAEVPQQKPDDGFAVERTFHAAVEATIAKAALDEAGIPCIAEYRPSNPQYPTTTKPLPPKGGRFVRD
jgi:DNA-directed RNA polymerase subunit RPC12/RpoP